MNINIGDRVWIEKPTVYSESHFKNKTGGAASKHQYDGVVQKIEGDLLFMECGTMAATARIQHVVRVESGNPF